MSELDVLLRESLSRLAEPGDPTGVADAVRARVGAAGAGGETPPGSGPTGGGGSAGAGGAAGGAGAAGTGFWGGWGLFAVLGVAGLVGGVGIALALPSGGDDSAPPPEPVGLTLPDTVPAAACPGGASVAELDAGARVLAVYQSEDGGFLAVRNPSALSQLVWLPADAGVADAGEDPSSLPVSGCEEAGEIVPIVTAAPEPLPEETTAPPDGGGGNNGGNNGGGGGPQPPADTTPPTIQVGNWSEAYICVVGSGLGPESASITVFVGDNVGVTSVSASSSTPGVSIAGPSGSGGQRAFTVSRTGTTNASISVSFTVGDAAGNTAGANAPALMSYSPGNCLG